MGALAPISPWIPEDDLLLKNAVEAGASLESLAKGAVRFSRRFTIRELQDRWHSLLYDPDISAEASARMVEFEHSASNIPLKPSRFNNSNGNDWAPEKRKVGTVRSHYYAMRKRICNEPCSSIDLNFLVAPAHNCTGFGDGCQEQLRLPNEPSVGNCMLRDPMSNHFEFQGTDFDIMHHAFPQMVRTDAPANSVGHTAHAYHTGHTDSLEDDLPDGIMGRDCLYGFAENVPHVSVEEAVGSGIQHSFEHDNAHKDIPHIPGENLAVFGNCAGVREIGPPQALPMGSLFETDDLETKPLSTFDSINNNPGIVCSGFDGSRGFSSPRLDCSASFHQLEYSSPLHRMPIWRTIDDISTQTLPIDASLEDKGQDARDTLTLHDNDDNDDTKKMHSSGCDIVHSESTLNERVSGGELGSSTGISEGDFVDLSNSLLNFENDEELLFMDEDGKDIMDTSCFDGLNSLLLNSPNDVHRDCIPSITEPKASVSPEACPCSGGSLDISDSLHSGYSSGHKVCDSEINFPSSIPALNPQFPELCNGVIFCVLNTEDPEIPCNDHILLPTEVSLTEQNSEEASSPPSSSTEDFYDNQMVTEQCRSLVKEEGETPAQPLSASRMIGSQVLPGIDPNHPGDECVIKSELPDSDSVAVVPKNAVSAGVDPNQCKSVSVTSKSVPVQTLKEGIEKVELGKHHNFDNPIDSYLEKAAHGSDNVKSFPRNAARGCKQEADELVATQKHMSSHGDPSPTEMAFPEPVVNPLISDQEEQLSESDDDVPYFSDIEAMILDMDLGPDEQDSYFSRKVTRYQCENAKRSIIRLEQGSHSYMQRAIASHGAFAILYGRHLKHYIKKPEVLLGRATDGVNVDIDLGIEGRANKVSRRQAILKIDEDGSFYLKNLGKCSILVNSKEVATGQRLSLSSSCLIEIRGMKFIFETNQNSVKGYLADIARRKSQDKCTEFEQSPGEIS